MKLSWSLFTKNIRPHAQLRLKLQQKVNKLEKQLAPFPEGTVHLKVTLERHPKKYWFTAALALKTPTVTLRCAKFSDDPMVAFDQAVRGLLRELSGIKAPAHARKVSASEEDIARTPIDVAVAVAAGAHAVPAPLPA